jgi:hypothetical protein
MLWVFKNWTYSEPPAFLVFFRMKKQLFKFALTTLLLLAEAKGFAKAPARPEKYTGP